MSPGTVLTLTLLLALTSALGLAVVLSERFSAPLGLLGGYSLTYGSLAGVIITLFFFFIIGLGLVIGAELNAALAETPAPTGARTSYGPSFVQSVHTVRRILLT